MVFCIIALALFSVMGLFSVRYRDWSKQAWHCAFRKLTFRPCDIDFEKRWKGKLSAKMGEVNPTLGKFFYQNFSALNWVFLIIMVASLAYAALGVYNLAAYNNCNGPDSGEFCPISGTGAVGGNAEPGQNCSVYQQPTLYSIAGGPK